MKRAKIATLIGLIAATLAGVSVAAPLDPLGPEMTARYPAVTVPVNTREPSLDGRVSKGEYGGIAALQDLVTIMGDDKGVAGPHSTKVWVCYNPKALYVAFRMEMPEGARPKVTVTEGRDKGQEDDAFEIFLVRGDRDGEQFHIGGNAAGVTWERNLEGGSHAWSGWDPKLRYATFVEDGAWGGEFEIPWSELGPQGQTGMSAPRGGAPKPGEVWRANFIANRRTPASRVEAWSYWPQWRERAGNGRLIFGAPGQAYFNFAGTWRDGWEAHRGGMFPNIQTPLGAKDPRKMQVILQLLRRDLSPAEEGSFHTELQARRAQATGEAATFATFEQDLGDVLKTFKPVESITCTKTLPDPGFSVGWGPKYRFKKEGDYLVRHHFKDITDAAKPFAIAGGALPVRIRAGVQAAVTPYLLTRQSVVITADLRAIPDLSKAARLRGFVTATNESKVLAEASIAYDKSAKQHVEVSVKDLPAGRDYRGHAELLDADGRVISAAWAPFKRPADPDWWVNRNQYGAQPEVPPPWTPIEWRNGVAKVWGRAITFGDSLLPKQIVSLAGTTLLKSQTDSPHPGPLPSQARGEGNLSSSLPDAPKDSIALLAKRFSLSPRQRGEGRGEGLSQLHGSGLGEEILAAPIRLELSGKPIAWQSVRVTEQRPGHLKLEAAQETAGVRVRGVNVFEFDGFSLVDLFIEPTGKEAKVDSLVLVVPVRAKFAEFLTNYRNAPGPGKRVPRHVGKTPARYASPPMLTTWLGTDHLGLEWSCESSRDWALANPDEAIVVEKKGDAVEARFLFVDAPITLDRARHIRFGLIATPTKPVPPERRNWRIDFASGPPPVPGKTTVEKFENSRERVVATDEHLQRHWTNRAGIDVHVALLPGDWSGHMVWHPRVSDPERAAIIREQQRLLKEHGMWVLRNGGWAVAPYAPEWDPWGKEMIALPKTPTFANQFDHSYASPFVEFFVGSWAMHARELGVRGIRFDTVFPWKPSENPYLGETWTASDGKTYGSQNLFRQREMVKRLYRIFHGGEVSDGIVYHPLAGPPIMAVESFLDVHEIGEGDYMRAKSLKEGYPQDAMRVWMTGGPYGFIAVNNIKGAPLTPNHRIGALLAAGCDPRVFKRPGVDIASYETRDGRMPTSRLWTAWSWIDRATGQWHPHWDNKDKLATTASAGGEHYVSFHLQPGRRILLVTVNYEPKPQDITVELRPDTLGFSSGAKFEAQDAITGKLVEINGSKLTLACGPELYRYVKIGPANELNGPNLDTKH